MATIFGTVASSYKKSITSRAGKTFDILMTKVEQGNGEVVEINMGFPNKAPKNIHAGNFYEFDTEFKYGEHKYVGHKQSSSTDAPAAPAGGASGDKPKYYEKNAGFLTKTFPIPMDHPDRSIIRQNAMTHAVKIVEATIPADEQFESADAMLEEVIRVAMKVEDFTTGDYEYKKLAEMETNSD